MRWVLLVVTASLSVGAAQSTACATDYQCGAGYCDPASHLCSKCLHCEDYKRSPPLTPLACVRTVSQCGACFEGLSESAAGDLQAACAPAGGASAMYAWIAGGALALSAAIVLLVVCVLRNKQPFRILTSTATSVQSPCRSEPASAPELPPPYNALYSPVRPDSPPTTYQDAEAPFLKPAPPGAPAREAAGAQAANVYNNPAYVRGPHLPASYHEEREDEPAYLHDETTAESPWTPADSDANANENSDSASGGASAESSGASSGAEGARGAGGAPALPALLAAARGTVLLRPPRDAAPAPPAKVPRLQQDTNNNRDSRERDDDDAMSRGAGAAAGGGPTFNIHVNVQQVNDLKL